jgi:Ser/Thr protein kinase RdoA (MazF antagonist)
MTGDARSATGDDEPTRPFVDGPPGALEPVWDAVRAAARHWGLPEPSLLRVGMNGIFVAGGVVLRVGRATAPAEASIELASVLTRAGVRVPRPARDEGLVAGPLTVTAWERLTLVDADPDWRAVGAMVRRVHALPLSAVPAGFPVPRGATFPWWQFDALLAEVDDLLDPAARDGLHRVVEAHRGWDVGAAEVLCHGDVHPGNVAMTTEGPVLLDWDLVCRAPAGWDHAPLLRAARWGWPTRWYEEFAAGYGVSLADDPTAQALAELRLVAATLMRLRAGRADPAAMPEAQHRLAYWRGDPAAPTWHPV